MVCLLLWQPSQVLLYYILLKQHIDGFSIDKCKDTVNISFSQAFIQISQRKVMNHNSIRNFLVGMMRYEGANGSQGSSLR